MKEVASCDKIKNNAEKAENTQEIKRERTKHNAQTKNIIEKT